MADSEEVSTAGTNVLPTKPGGIGLPPSGTTWPICETAAPHQKLLDSFEVRVTTDEEQFDFSVRACARAKWASLNPG
eukprot:SAG31_NODE_609_length_13567_cov_18.101574_9_plen_77_part_00